MKNSTQRLVVSALMASLTCIATMVIKIATPTFGYIHLGDGMVLLCGILLGPAGGALTAGLGSCMADLFSGYAAWAPATFLIKALTAAAAGFLFRLILRRSHAAYAQKIGVLLGGLAGEMIMVIGYFLYETGLAAASSGGLTTAALAAGAASSAAGIPFNAVQGITGIIVCLALLPVLLKIPVTRNEILAPHP